ncbi:MAG: DNA alkylation repair protein [Candidatus Pacebacteria bacterium]|nr:DNA alkylation repair protein [Candidatus Paceibacterota bacterium]
MVIEKIKADLKAVSKKSDVKILQRFFKTGPGEYGEGDIFIGVRVPQQREIARKYYSEISWSEIQTLIQSPIHEERLTALLILVLRFEKTEIDKEKTKIYNFYLKNLKYINNWDLVDLSASKIVGAYIFNYKKTDKDKLFKLAEKKHLWSRRVAVIATFYFIKKGEYKTLFKLAEMLLADKHDLMHKAVGWMLREVGNNCGQEIEEEFLKKYYKKMPRTMLRYAIEKFPEEKRQAYLAK